MRSLNVTDNTDSATLDYPYRKVRDTDGVTPGTKLWDRIFGDLLHGMQKLIRLVGLTPNDLPDNESNGYQILDAFELLGQSRVFQASWVDQGAGDKYILADSNIPALIVGKMYRFFSDKNILPADNIYLKVGAVDYAINFQNCSYILSNQAFNVYVTAANNVTITAVGSLNEFRGSAISRFENTLTDGLWKDIFRYKGKYYVVRSNRVRIYSNEGEYITLFGANGSGLGSFNGAYGIAIINDKIYVSDTGNARIQAFDLNGNVLFEFGSTELFEPLTIRGSEITNKIYAFDFDDQVVNAYNSSDGLYSFAVNAGFVVIDIAVHGELLYILVDKGAGETEIKTYNAASGAFIDEGINKFTAGNNILKFYGVNDNYFILQSDTDVVLVDRNYSKKDLTDQYRDILKTVIYGYDFSFGNTDNEELYFVDNSADADRFSINKFI